MSARTSPRFLAATVVAGYLALTLWFSWPLAAHLTTSLAGDWGDAVFTTWAMRGMNDLVLRNRGLSAMTEPVTALLLYGLVLLAIGIRLFRSRHSAR